MEAEGDFKDIRGEGTQRQTGVMRPQAKERGQPPEAGRGRVQILPWSLGGSVPLPTILILSQ